MLIENCKEKNILEGRCKNPNQVCCMKNKNIEKFNNEYGRLIYFKEDAQPFRKYEMEDDNLENTEKHTKQNNPKKGKKTGKKRKIGSKKNKKAKKDEKIRKQRNGKFIFSILYQYNEKYANM